MVWVLSLGSVGLATGNGLITPNVNALISRHSSAEDQGLNLGLSASSASFARIVGPAAAGVAFELLGPGIPMLVGAAIVGVVLLLALVKIPRPKAPRRRDLENSM